MSLVGEADRVRAISGTLGIICGSGNMPLLVARAAKAAGNRVFLIGIAGEADPAIETFPHAWLGFGEVGRLFQILEREDCRDLVIIGKVARPNFKSFKFDLGIVKALPRVLSTAAGADNTILSTIVNTLEKMGYRVHGAHEVAPELLLRPGFIGRRKPSRHHRSDIALGARIIKKFGEFDIGQAVVVRKGQTVAVEAAEGTDAMLQRVAEISRRDHQSGGVLVKLPKPRQEIRVDMPTLGVATIEGAVAAGLDGIAAQANRTLIADQEAVRAAADKAGVFIAGTDFPED